MWQAWAEGCASSVMSSTPSTRQTSAHLVRDRVRVSTRQTSAHLVRVRVRVSTRQTSAHLVRVRIRVS